jgi:hypothetical protein
MCRGNADFFSVALKRLNGLTSRDVEPFRFHMHDCLVRCRMRNVCQSICLRMMFFGIGTGLGPSFDFDLDCAACAVLVGYL